MLAGAIEAHLLGKVDILTQFIVRWCGKQSVRKISLIQNQLHLVRMVIQAYNALLNRYFSHAEVAAYFIQNVPVA
ncbi:hypothetical protein D3C78_1766410 [compost metagenome]